MQNRNDREKIVGSDVSSEKLVFRDESYAIVGSCFEVYKEKGNGFLESVYQECLQKEMSWRGVSFSEKPRLQVYYKGHALNQWYEPDFLCYERIILEIKAIKKVTDEHRAQLINYLKATGLRLGLLVNFGHYPKIEHERLLN